MRIIYHHVPIYRGKDRPQDTNIISSEAAYLPVPPSTHMQFTAIIVYFPQKWPDKAKCPLPWWLTVTQTQASKMSSRQYYFFPNK